MGDRGELADAVAEIEDMRTVGEGVQDGVRLAVEFGTARQQQQRIEIALDGQARGSTAAAQIGSTVSSSAMASTPVSRA